MTYDDLVVIDFLDHAQGKVKPAKCRIVGRLVEQDEDAYYVENWIFLDPAQKEEFPDDTEQGAIVKGAVTAIHGIELKPWTSPPYY